MQKKIIALAVAGLMSGAAFAQSNVTVYGVADLGQAWVKSSGNTANSALVDQKSVGRLDNNSSYIGFKGAEKMGNGLTAVFQFEVGYNADNGDGFVTPTLANEGSKVKGTGRDSYVGLAGAFGTVVAGNLTHPLRAMGAKTDVLPGAAGFGTHASITGEFNGTKTGADDRAKNAIAYVSPAFLGGLTVTGAYVNGEARQSQAQVDAGEEDYNAKQWQVAVQYENGPIYLGAGYHKAYDFGIAYDAATKNFDDGGTDARVYRFAGVYSFPFGLKLMGLYDNTKLDLAGGGDQERAAWSLGAAYTVGAHTVGLQYARANEIDVSGGADLDTKNKIYALSYSYALSKRTSIHARYSKLDNDKAGTSSFYNNAVGNPESGAAGSEYTGYMVGVRHSF